LFHNIIKSFARLVNILRGVERALKINFSRRKEFGNLGEECDAYVWNCRTLSVTYSSLYCIKQIRTRNFLLLHRECDYCAFSKLLSECVYFNHANRVFMFLN